MSVYLTIITSVLVATQIFRVIQNAISLRKYSEINAHNDELMAIWRKVERYIDDKSNCVQD